MKPITLIRNKAGIVKDGNKKINFKVHGAAREIVRGITTYDTNYFLAFMNPYNLGFKKAPTIGEFYNRILGMGLGICHKSDIFYVAQSCGEIESFAGERALLLGMMPHFSSADKLHRILVFRMTYNVPVIQAIRSLDIVPLNQQYIFRVPKNHPRWFSMELLRKS